MKSVLVMGGSYFIGKSLVNTLISNQYEVTVLNRGSKKLNNPNVKELISDRNEISNMKKILEGLVFDYVIDISGLNKNQMEILCNSLDISKLKKFIFLSSSAVYDIDYLDIPFKENDKVAENSIWTSYGKNKIEAEMYLKNILNDSGVDFITLRPPYVYGEENYVQRESFIFEHIENEKPIILPNKGKSKLQFIYSKDLALIIESFLRQDTESYMVFNVGNSTSMTCREWIGYCEKIINKKAILIEFDYKTNNRKVREFFPFWDYSNVLCTEKIKSYYDKETDFLIGLNNAYQWYCENKENINFKEEVTKNEIEILNSLNTELKLL